MKISEALRNYRQEIGLSQKEFIGDIISAAQYSRIEKGTQEINLSTTLLLLTSNHINVSDFIIKILPDYNNDDEGNLHDEAYREHPYSGIGFMLHHAHEENSGCPIASYECDGGI